MGTTKVTRRVEMKFRGISDTPAFLEGYWDGLQFGENLNPYVELSPEWTDYELGWEEGWLDD